MNQLTSGGLGVLGVFIALFLLILAVLWFFLPFAIFGTKDKLNLLINEIRKTNRELEKIRAEMTGFTGAAAAPSSEATSNEESSDASDTDVQIDSQSHETVTSDTPPEGEGEGITDSDDAMLLLISLAGFVIIIIFIVIANNLLG